MKKKRELTQAEKERNYKAALWQREQARKRREEEEKERVLKEKKGKKISGVGAEKKFDVIEKCKKIAPDLITELETIAKKGRTAHKLRAIDLLLDRAYGKAKENISVSETKVIEIVRAGKGRKPADKSEKVG
jgi:hypothetical protein